MKKFFLSIPLLLAFITSCTLVDKDLRPQHDVPGVSEVAHVEDENGFVDYKYQSNVLVFTEDVEQYVITLDTLTKTLYMADYTPDDYLPSEGMVLAGLASEKMAEGLHHKVVSRAKVGSQYVIALEEATLQEIFEHLTLRLGSDTDDLTADSLGADESRLITRGDDNSGVHDFTVKFPFRFPFKHDFDGKKIGKSLAKVDGSIEGNLDFTTTCNVKVYCYYTNNPLAFDIWIQEGVGDEINFDVSGNINGKWDFLGTKDAEGFSIADKLSLKIPLTTPVPGLVLLFKLKPSAEMALQFKGTLNLQKKEAWGLRIGARYNIPNKPDGPFCYKIKGPEPLPKGNCDLSVGAEFGFDVGFETELSINETVGLYGNFSIGPHFSVNSANSLEGEQRKFHTSIPMDVEAGFFAEAFGLRSEWDLLGVILDAFKLKDGDHTADFFKSDFFFYPQINEFEATAYEGDMNKPPFKMVFDVDDTGIFVNEGDAVRPFVHCYEVSKYNFNTGKGTCVWSQNLDTLRVGKRCVYTYPIPSGKIERNKVYVAVIDFYKGKDGKVGDSDYLNRFMEYFSTYNWFACIVKNKQVYAKKEATLKYWMYNFEYYVDMVVYGSVTHMKEWGIDVINEDGTYSQVKVYDTAKMRSNKYRLYFKITIFTYSAKDLARKLTLRPYVFTSAEQKIEGEPVVLDIKYSSDNLNDPERKPKKSNTVIDLTGDAVVYEAGE